MPIPKVIATPKPFPRISTYPYISADFPPSNQFAYLSPDFSEFMQAQKYPKDLEKVVSTSFAFSFANR